IAVNAVAPGFMRTPMSVIDGVDETTTEDFQTWYVQKRHIPMARTGYPEDVSGAFVFLASDYCRYMTGQVLVRGGGLTSTFYGWVASFCPRPPCWTAYSARRRR